MLQRFKSEGKVIRAVRVGFYEPFDHLVFDWQLLNSNYWNIRWNYKIKDSEKSNLKKYLGKGCNLRNWEVNFRWWIFGGHAKVIVDSVFLVNADSLKDMLSFKFTWSDGLSLRVEVQEVISRFTRSYFRLQICRCMNIYCIIILYCKKKFSFTFKL